MKTYVCKPCAIAWPPIWAKDGQCPLCLGGTVQSREPISDEAEVLFDLVLIERARADRVERFEAYYEARTVESEGKTLVAEPEPR